MEKHGHIIDVDLEEYLRNLIAEGDSTLTMDSLSVIFKTFYFSTIGQYVNFLLDRLTVMTLHLWRELSGQQGKYFRCMEHEKPY